jgi:hypothetical protein
MMGLSGSEAAIRVVLVVIAGPTEPDKIGGGEGDTDVGGD